MTAGGRAAAVAAARRRVHADALDELAAAVAYHAFLALVPLLALATAALGVVLVDEAARRAVVAGLAGTVATPLLQLALLPDGPLATAIDGALSGVAAVRGPLGVVGAVGLALTGLRLGGALGAGVAAAFRVPRPRGATARLRAAAVAPLLAALGLTGVVVPALAGGSRAALPVGLQVLLPGPLTALVGTVAAVALDTVVVAALYRVLLPAVGRLRDHLPAAVLVAVGWAALRLLGGAFVGARVASAGAVWGALAGVVTVLVLLHLLARLLLVGALVSALARERRAGGRAA